MSSRDNVQLAWAMVAGRLTHISVFRDVPRGQRPTAVCEVCGAHLTMKLGPIRAHHYSHRSRSHCPLTAPETARHYNTKHTLASKLRATDALSVVTRCTFSSKGNRCPNDIPFLAAEGWDTVRVEPFIEPVRPDIVLLANGAPIFAIEVRATHAVSENKAASLSKLGIPWIEVVAGAQCDEWVPGSLLPAARHSKDALNFCSVHSDTVVQARASKVPPQATALTSTADTSPVQTDVTQHGYRWRFRVVDCYPTCGPRVRKVFWIHCSTRNRIDFRLRVVDDDTSFVVTSTRLVRNPEGSLRELNQRLVEHLRRSYDRFHSARPWLDSGAFPDNPATVYSRDFMSVKYQRDSDGKWTNSLRRADALQQVEADGPAGRTSA